MSHKVSLVRVLTAATGNSTPITLGAAYSQLFMLPSEAGAMDGRTYTYNIVDGNNWEIGRGVYNASGTTLARTTIIASRISGTLGTSRISLSGTAQVRFIDSAEDMDGVRGTRAVTGTTDTLGNSDLGYVVTYSNATAVTVSLAQASVSNLFLDGWAVWVKNKGVGAVTITPATSTIDGAATLVLATNQGALIWSDGTNYQSFRFQQVGTTAGTVAAGDDARIVGAAQKSAVPGANVLINSDFRINQRGYVSAATLAASVYAHDRWKAGASGGDYSFTQLASSTQITIASGKSLIQVVEDKNVVGGSYVLSWSGTSQARVGINTATPSGSYASSPILITGQTAGTTMSVEFNAGTLGTVKLEIGAAVTPFVMPDYQPEFAKCLRYFELLLTGTGNNRIISTYPPSGFLANVTWLFKVTKRAIPTIVLVNSSGAADSTSQDCITLSILNTYALIGSGSTASAEL